MNRVDSLQVYAFLLRFRLNFYVKAVTFAVDALLEEEGAREREHERDESSEKTKKLEEWNGTNTFHISRNKKTRSFLEAISCLRTEEEGTLGAMEEEEVRVSEEDTDSSLCTIKRNEKTKLKGKVGNNYLS